MTLPAYSRKLMQRAEGIWHNMGLCLERQESSCTDGRTSIVLRFNRISATQAELLVSEMSKAFRRANIYWKEDGNILIRIEIPEL